MNGLTANEVVERRAKFGKNRLPSKKGVSAWIILLNQLKSPVGADAAGLLKRLSGSKMNMQQTSPSSAW